MELSPDIGLFIWTLITFLLLIALLSRFAFKPLRAALAQREKTISDSVEKATAAREEAQRVLQENEKMLNAARVQAREIIDAGNRLVDDMKQQANESAKEEAEAIIEQAQREIDRQLQKSLDELKGTVANLSIRVARQVIREGLDETRHTALADQFIERLKKSHASQRR